MTEEKKIKTPYDIAKEELAKAICEVPGPGNNMRIIEYHGCTTLKATSDSVSWCSSFANYCVFMARKTGWLGAHETKSSMARSWLLYGNKTDSPKEGDIVVFSRGENKISGHVGFVVKVGTLYIECLGGNQHDMVSVAKFPRWRVLGYRTGE